MLCPCCMKMTGLNCALSCLFEGSERLQIQSLFPFLFLLLKVACILETDDSEWSLSIECSPYVRHMPGSQEIWRDWFEFCPWEAIVEAFLPLKIKLVWITSVHSWELWFSWSTLPPAPVSIFPTSLHLALTYMWNSIPCLVYIINQLPPSVHEIHPEYLEVKMKVILCWG